MSKTANTFSPEVRERAVRLVLDHGHGHPSRWAAITSIASKIGCTAQTLSEWVKKAEVDAGKRTGVPTEMAERMKALDQGPRKSFEAVEYKTLEWVDRSNRQRLLEPIGNIPLADAEANSDAALEPTKFAAYGSNNSALSLR